MSNVPSDPEADADTLDDDELLEAYLASGQKPIGPPPIAVPDWPALRKASAILLDPLIADWFKARHSDWQDEIEFVLRAWIRAKDHAGDASG